MRGGSEYARRTSAVVLVALLGLTSPDVSSPADGAVIAPDDPAQVALGEKIYADHCRQAARWHQGTPRHPQESDQKPS
jgi:hypothetical protein